MDPSACGRRASLVAILPAIILAVSLSAGPTWAERAATKSDFEGDQVGSVPPGFSPGLTGKGAPPDWKVVDDPTAPAGPRVVAETSGDRTNDRFPLLILDGFEARDVRVSVAFKPVSGRVDQAAGIVVRLKDANNYYIARANALEGNVRLYKVVGGKRSQFAGKDDRVPSSRMGDTRPWSPRGWVRGAAQRKGPVRGTRPDVQGCWKSGPMDEGGQRHLFRQLRVEALP